MANLPAEILKVARPVHWVKNLALFAALILSGDLLSKFLLGKITLAFIAFCFATSTGYILNDILDARLDRLHPIKKERPIAAKRLPVPIALVVMGATALVALYLASGLNYLFFLSLSGYLLLQASYSFGLKNLMIIDILIIATGFILRVYAGAFVIDAHLSVWFLLCVISTALFLASGKRRAELGLISEAAAATRKNLARYSKSLLDSYVTMFGSAAWLSWALFTFFESPSPSLPVWLLLAEISRTTTISKLMMITIPVAIFGIMRYEGLIFENKTESPEKLLLTDMPLMASVLLWLFMVVLIIYGGVTTLI